jgi:hypothetical protein
MHSWRLNMFPFLLPLSTSGWIVCAPLCRLQSTVAKEPVLFCYLLANRRTMTATVGEQLWQHVIWGPPKMKWQEKWRLWGKGVYSSHYERMPFRYDALRNLQVNQEHKITLVTILKHQSIIYEWDLSLWQWYLKYKYYVSRHHPTSCFYKTSFCLYFKTQGFEDWILQSIELVGKHCVLKYV